jgi:hypothetical protein
MKNPEISPNFTLDDIDKIRDYAGERYISVPEEEFRGNTCKFLTYAGRNKRNACKTFYGGKSKAG